MAESAGDKKHEASQYRREQAREKGQVARSQDLVASILLLGIVLVMRSFGEGLFQALQRVMERQFTEAQYWDSDVPTVFNRLLINLADVGIALLPLMLAGLFLAFVANWIQVGFLILPDKINIDWSRIDPIQGFGRIFSIQGAMRLLFGILKIGVIGIVVIGGLWSDVAIMLNSSHLSIEEVGSFLWSTSIDTAMQAGIILFVLSIVDFGFQKWKYEQDLMMTDQDVRDENKMMQGDPQLIARRRAVQRQLSQQRVGAAVPKADVVITNPTELAIAIQYDPTTMVAPIVVAKGADAMAKKIRQIALQHGIPIVERKPLAQALFKTVEIGRPIPLEQYTAVAEVLKYVYQLQGKKIPALDPRRAA